MKLVFVYNADSGVFNTLSDIAHKLLSPATYQCDLCSLTHGYFSARDEWVDFLQDLDVEIEFLHRDEYSRVYARQVTDSSIDFPAIFIKNNEQLKLWLDKGAIGGMSSTEELMNTIRDALVKQQSEDEQSVTLSVPA